MMGHVILTALYWAALLVCALTVLFLGVFAWITYEIERCDPRSEFKKWRKGK